MTNTLKLGSKMKTIPFHSSPTLYECKSCGCTRMTEEDVTYTVFSGNREEPAEYGTRCPECLSLDVHEIPVFWCRSCEDVQVQDDGEQCSECRQEQLEDQAQRWGEPRMMEED